MREEYLYRPGNPKTDNHNTHMTPEQIKGNLEQRRVLEQGHPQMTEEELKKLRENGL